MLIEIFDIYLIFANTISFLLAVINSFLLNKYWTFNDSNKKYTQQFFKFLFVSFIGLLLNNLLMLLFVNLNIWYVFAKIIVIIIVAFWNYLMNNSWTFNNQRKKV